MERRLHEHNTGHSKFTSTGMPWKIVYKKEFNDLLLAKQWETKIKKMKSRTFIENLITQSILPK